MSNNILRFLNIYGMVFKLMTYLIIISLIALSAIFSGLTIGLFSLDKDDLRFKSELGDVGAKKIYNLRKKSNQLLCTLLIGTVAANATLSIFLGSITSGIIAGFLSTALIVIFGEILPQAVFARHALYLGAKTAYLAEFFILVFSPVCYPLSRILDKLLGKEMPSYYTKKELVKLIEHHEDSEHKVIDTDEERILKGALSYSDKTVASIMTPLDKVFAIPHDLLIDRESVVHISLAGRSRIPVYREHMNDIVGILYAKDFVHDNHYGKIADETARKNVIFVNHNQKLDEVLNLFKKTRNHLFIVKDEQGNSIGLVTIEDILEEIIGEEIHDEFDKR